MFMTAGVLVKQQGPPSESLNGEKTASKHKERGQPNEQTTGITQTCGRLFASSSSRPLFLHHGLDFFFSFLFSKSAFAIVKFPLLSPSNWRLICVLFFV
jgi:hypothetical protein